MTKQSYVWGIEKSRTQLCRYKRHRAAFTERILSSAGHTLRRGPGYDSRALITMWLTSSGLSGSKETQERSKVAPQTATPAWTVAYYTKGYAHIRLPVIKHLFHASALNFNSMQGQLPYYRKNKKKKLLYSIRKRLFKNINTPPNTWCVLAAIRQTAGGDELKRGYTRGGNHE